MTLPIENTTTLVESIMSDVRGCVWSRLPPMQFPAPQKHNEVVEGRGPSWRVVVARWKQGTEFHYEAVATAQMKKSPLVVRLPPSDAAQAWALAEPHLH